MSRTVEEIKADLALLQIHRLKRSATMTRLEYERSCAATVDLLKELAKARKEARDE